MYRLTKDAELAIIPNATHFSTLTELGIGTVVDFFLRQSKATVTSVQ
jgi:hypothetical protein